ncbi:ABC transporter G family member 1 [Orchesella cincta]|uniref:ABC transporter G family member 1 n=1 Tax=Orchesella cincta TaxID=48709 RepID=A0A1D2MQT2_ORCCI|nr:ABC transporter G family member 1 [Orchesella cincta]
MALALFPTDSESPVPGLLVKCTLTTPVVRSVDHPYNLTIVESLSIVLSYQSSYQVSLVSRGIVNSRASGQFNRGMNLDDEIDESHHRSVVFPHLQCRGLCYQQGPVRALDGVFLDLRGGEMISVMATTDARVAGRPGPVPGPIERGGLADELRDTTTSSGMSATPGPEIICLDQPTRGMDIFDTFFLVEYLKQWAYTHGRIVL